MKKGHRRCYWWACRKGCRRPDDHTGRCYCHEHWTDPQGAYRRALARRRGVLE